jgi:hypothetical protein
VDGWAGVVLLMREEACACAQWLHIQVLYRVSGVRREACAQWLHVCSEGVRRVGMRESSLCTVRSAAVGIIWRANGGGGRVRGRRKGEVGGKGSEGQVVVLRQRARGEGGQRREGVWSVEPAPGILF